MKQSWVKASLRRGLGQVPCDCRHNKEYHRLKQKDDTQGLELFRGLRLVVERGGGEFLLQLLSDLTSPIVLVSLPCPFTISAERDSDGL